MKLNHLVYAFSLTAALAAPGLAAAADVAILNVSYDPTRELYADYNKVFTQYWKSKTGDNVTVKTSHGGSGAQARSVIDGLEADVVTLGIATDVDAIAEKGGKLINPGWEKHLPNNAVPYTSTVVFLVRKGNPKGLKDWQDLVKPGVGIIVPNPKTSSGGRWAYLAAYGYAYKANRNDAGKAKDYIARFYRNVPVLDTGARGSTTTFAERGIGDVLVSWEDEAILATREHPESFDIVVPSVSIQAEPVVAVVDKIADKHGTRKVAEAYLQFLYTPQGQEIAAKHYYRPNDKAVFAKYAAQFPKLNTFTVREVYGDWPTLIKTHLADGALFDQIYQPGAK
jgi:sulfate transport system substrate-binding protein